MNAARDGENVILRLSYAEAVVLDGLLHRLEQQGLDETLPFEDQAEQRVLWDLTASLEPMIGEVLGRPEVYKDLLARSRGAVRDSVE